MKNTKIKGFSLAEVMIAMLVISIALAAAIPTITKRNAGSDNIWRAGTQTVGGETKEDANTLAFTGPNILIGASRLPLLSNDRYFADSRFDDGLKISPKDDKLIIFKEIADNADRFKSSHIGLYNSPTEYAGRLASDKYNLALGIGTLQSLQPNYPEGATAIPQGAYNTAIGQYALLTNRQGSYNTAFGYNALRGNSVASVSGNIALGDNALRSVSGNNNIAIGSRAGETLTGDNNIVVGANTGNGLNGSNNILITTMNGNPTSELEDLLRGSRDDDKYPLIGDSGNFAIGILNNKKANKLLPPIIQGFTTIQTCSGDTQPCADGVLYAKGLVINADTFNIKTKDGAKTIFSVRENPSKEDFSVANNDLNSAVNIATATETPCDGAPICLAKFNVTTGSLYTNDDRLDMSGFPKQKYERRSIYPRFKDSYVNNTGLQDNDDNFYDLYIGSMFNSDSDFEFENNKELTGSNSHDNYSKSLIDVGKEDTNDPLELSRLSSEYAEGAKKPISSMDDAARPSVLNEKKSLKIRTVKTAVNFLDEFKEKSNWIEMLRDRVEFNMNYLFHYTENVEDKLKFGTACNTSGQKSDWEKIKTCDPCYYKENGMDLLGGFCDWHYTQKQKRQNRINAFKACFGEFFGFMSCMKKELSNYDNDTVTIECSTSSDARLKNIAGDNTAGLDEINKLQVYNYTYKADKSQTPHVGVMAQDLKKVFPNAVKKGSDGYYRIRLEDMFYAMVNSVKELTKKKDELNTLTVDYIDAPLSELEKQNADIKAQNDLLKQKNEEIEKRLSQMEAK